MRGSQQAPDSTIAAIRVRTKKYPQVAILIIEDAQTHRPDPGISFTARDDSPLRSHYEVPTKSWTSKKGRQKTSTTREKQKHNERSRRSKARRQRGQQQRRRVDWTRLPLFDVIRRSFSRLALSYQRHCGMAWTEQRICMLSALP